MAPLPQTQALGQATGSTGNVAAGPVVLLQISGPGYLSEVGANLREGSDTSNGLTYLGGGAVLVEMQLCYGTPVTAGWPIRARWRRASYVGTSIGPLYHPDIYLQADEVMTLAVRVFCRDNIRSATRIVVDVEAYVTPMPSGSADWDPFPFGRFEPGTGHRVSLLSTDPPAGNQGLLHTVPAGLARCIVSMRGTVVTTATAGNRLPALILRDTADADYGHYTIQAAVAASSTCDITWSVQTQSAVVSSLEQSAPIPLLLLRANHDIVASMEVAIDANDNFGAFQIWFEEWVTPEVIAS